MPALKWTEEKIRAEAAKYPTKVEFKRGSYGAYQVACRLKLIDQLGFINQKESWTEEKIRFAASFFSTRSEFALGNWAAYQVANLHGMMDSLFDHAKEFWPEERVRAVASGFRTKTDFRNAVEVAYAKALQLGIIDELGFEPGETSDNDAIYIWRAVNRFFNGNPVYKIGVTSQRLGIRRICDVARDGGFEFELICCEAVKGRASDLEKKLLILGEHPGYSGFNGSTEFRALSDSALYSVICLICGAM